MLAKIPLYASCALTTCFFSELKVKYLASNLVYVSIAHDDKTVDDYFSRLDEIFKLVKKCENHELNIDQLIKTEPAHTTFKRLN